MFPKEQRVTILYRNYKGVTKLYHIYPMSLWFGNTEFYPDNQWLLAAMDTGDNKRKDFAMSNIASWEVTSFS